MDCKDRNHLILDIYGYRHLYTKSGIETFWIIEREGISILECEYIGLEIFFYIAYPSLMLIGLIFVENLATEIRNFCNLFDLSS